MEEKIQELRAWIESVTPEGLGIAVPVSGGSDGALCFWLYASVFPERTVGVHFGEALRSASWFDQVGSVRMLPQPATAGSREVARWAALLDICLSESRVLIGTRNRTEQVLGTYSTASRAAFHQPLAGLWKSEVLDLCESVGVPDEILASSQAADPECGRPEEMSKIPFRAVDDFCKEKMGLGEASGLDRQQRDYLEGLFQRNRFKAPLPLSGPVSGT